MLDSSKSSSQEAIRRDSVGSTVGQSIVVVGFVLYSAFAPHSIAGAAIGLTVTFFGWMLRSLRTGSFGLRHTKLDLPIWLFAAWTVASAFLSEEPSISIPKLQASWVLLLFYMTQAVMTRRLAITMVSVMLLSGVAGTVFSVFDLIRGRGVIVSAIREDSPLRRLQIRVGDTIWRVNKQRVYSAEEIDAALQSATPGTTLNVSVISSGEHVERPGLSLTENEQRKEAPAGITSSGRLHRFRASGWTRHYETFSEVLQILAQLALGIALAHLRNHGANFRFKLALAASAILALGIVLTAMRTVLVALMIGSVVILLKAAQGKTKLFAAAALTLLLLGGTFFISQTRAEYALALRDPSASLRFAVARAGVSRILLHPVFGHGVDAVHKHWNEWGFPGNQLLGLHSTPLQLAFDRGLPALGLWLWLMMVCWLTASRTEHELRDTSDTTVHGLLLGTTGAIAGFFASSLVNYNFGDAEVALLFWWMIGTSVVLGQKTNGSRQSS